ncbi:hypothetical protein SDC9_16877 [bioreactor metagenome]|uniref:Uncharacterized protein n=1 Tax=bioreactor metagenome TaxID=1076179 RepID=A0A644TXD1_9ZZZZ
MGGGPLRMPRPAVSHRVKVKLGLLLLGQLGHVMHLLTLGHQEVLDQFLVEDAPDQRVFGESIDRKVPGRGQLREALRIGVADDRIVGDQAVLDADQRRAQNRGDAEIGVHVAARHAMLDPPRRGARGRDSQRCGAVLIGPADAGRRMGVRYKALEAVRMWREDQGRAGQGGKAAGDRGAHRLRSLLAAVIEDVAPVAVEHREMHVHAVARPQRIGFRHERGGKAMAAGKPLHQHLEGPGVIGGLQRVGLVHQVQLELARPGFRDCGVGGNIHRLAGVIKRAEEGVEGIEGAQAQRFAAGAPLARAGRGRHPQGLAAVVDQEEFKLGRDHRGQAAVLVAVNDAGQRLARIAGIGPAVHVEHPDRQKRGRRGEPGHRHEAALGRAQQSVAIAGLEDERAVLDVLAPDVEVHHREGKPRPLGEDLVGEPCGDALAPRHPVQVRRCHANGAHFGVFSQPVHVLT